MLFVIWTTLSLRLSMRSKALSSTSISSDDVRIEIIEGNLPAPCPVIKSLAFSSDCSLIGRLILNSE